MKRIVLHIDKLVLRGIDRADTAAVSDGIQAELQRVLTQPGSARSIVDGGDRRRISADAVRGGGQSLEQSVARSITGGMVGGAKQ